MNYQYFPPHLIVKEGIHGIGVFTTVNVKKGEVLFELTGEILDHPTRTSIQIGEDMHIEDIVGGHVNHSCTPTAKVFQSARALVSLSDIPAGEEITFDYNDNEDKLSSPFECACCGKIITGKNTASVDTPF